MSRNNRVWLRGIPLMLVFLGLILSVWAMREEHVQMKWEELSAVLPGKTVSTVLRSGSAIEGKVLSVEQDALRIDISETSDGYDKGPSSIRRFQISVLRVESTSGPWRGIGAAIGGGAGAAGGAAAYSRFDNENASGAGAGIAAGLIGGGAVLGYLLGRSADRKALIISVVD
jgi:hypothetical protein